MAERPEPRRRSAAAEEEAVDLRLLRLLERLLEEPVPLPLCRLALRLEGSLRAHRR